MQPGAVPQPKPMMTIQESVRTCIRKYADFSGRATRAEFWWWVLATTVVAFAFGAVDGFINSFTGPYSFSPLSTIFGLAVLLPDLAVTLPGGCTTLARAVGGSWYGSSSPSWAQYRCSLA